jgi:small subunit ribosomal protein S11
MIIREMSVTSRSLRSLGSSRTAVTACRRCLSSSSRQLADNNKPSSPSPTAPSESKSSEPGSAPKSAGARLASLFATKGSWKPSLLSTTSPSSQSSKVAPNTRDIASLLDYDSSSAASQRGGLSAGPPQPYHLHVVSSKHNTHLTFTSPRGDPIISLTTGNIGFKKSNRGSYDAAYQLASHTFTKMRTPEIQRGMHRLELILRGFGQGRDAVTKAIMGVEGAWLRDRISRVTDATRLKFGGSRSPRPRRLG